MQHLVFSLVLHNGCGYVSGIFDTFMVKINNRMCKEQTRSIGD